MRSLAATSESDSPAPPHFRHVHALGWSLLLELPVVLTFQRSEALLAQQHRLTHLQSVRGGDDVGSLPCTHLVAAEDGGKRETGQPVAGILGLADTGAGQGHVMCLTLHALLDVPHRLAVAEQVQDHARSLRVGHGRAALG